MGYNTNIELAHLHAIEELIRYVEEHGDNATYDKLVNHLSWYWQHHGKDLPTSYCPQGWIIECIKFLSGET